MNRGRIYSYEEVVYMDWGMKNRISRIIKPKTNRTVMFAVDHGYFLGPTTGLEQFKKNIEPIVPYADTLMLTRGMLRSAIAPSFDVPIVLRVSGGPSILGELSDEDITVSMEDALRLNASGIALSIFVGSKNESKTIVNLSRLVDEGEAVGMPVIAVTAVGKDMVRDARYLGLASRMAAEHGAHIVKTYFCDEFEKIVDSCPVPIVIAGGKKLPEMEALQLTYSAISKGAVGVDMGRNIFQSDCPIGMIKAVRSIVHDKHNVKEAFEVYNEARGQKKK